MKWLESYEPGVPSAISPEQYVSLVALAEEGFKQHAHCPCYINFGVTLTYQQLDELTQAFAGFLQTTAADLSLGDRVAIMLPNLLQYPVVIWGALRAGMSVVNINPQYTPRELHAILKDSGAKCVVVLAHLIPVLAAALPDTHVKEVIVTEIGDCLAVKGKLMNVVMRLKYSTPHVHLDLPVTPFNETLTSHYRAAFNRVEVASSALAFLQYTGGTTGEPKGAMLTHRNMVANLLQVYVWIHPFLEREKGKVEKGIITALPLYPHSSPHFMNS